VSEWLDKIGSTVKCPKCGEEGYVELHRVVAKGRAYAYVVIRHRGGRRCVVARLESEPECPEESPEVPEEERKAYKRKGEPVVEVPVSTIIHLVESYKRMVEARKAREELLRKLARERAI